MSRRYNLANTVVFWDIEDCPIPDGLDAMCVRNNIRRGLEEKGYNGRISTKAYGDWDHMKDDFAGFAINNCPDRLVRRTAMLVDFLNTAMNNGKEKLNLMLILGDISGDIGFLGAIRAMKLGWHCNEILLSQPQIESGDPIYGVSTEWLWNKLATGEDLSQNSEPHLSW